MFKSFCLSLPEIVSERLNSVTRRCDDNIVNVVFIVREAPQTKRYFLGIIPKPVTPPPPLGTVRNKNVTFGQKWIFKAKNIGHQNFI